MVSGVAAQREGDYYHRQVSASNANAATQLDVAVLEIPGDLTERQLFFAGDPEAFAYDDDGNMTQDGVWSYEWDGENRLKAMQMRPEIAEVRLGGAGTDPWVRLEFEYDWGGRRIAKRYLTATQSQVTHEGGGVYTIAWDRPLRQNFVYDGWLLSASYRTKDDGEYLSVDQSYAWGPDLSDSPGGGGGAGGIGGLAIYQDDLADSDGGTYIGPMFPAYDGNGNVVALYRLAPSSLMVEAAARYDYGPFGEALGLTGKQAHRFPFRWSTKFTDAETGLVYYGYRYYHPSLGRWISRDPIEERDGPNVFAFVGNDLVNAVDPLGQKRLIALFHGQNIAGLDGGGARSYMETIQNDLTATDNEIKIFGEDDDNFWNRESIAWFQKKQQAQETACDNEHIVVLIGHSNGGDAARKVAQKSKDRYPNADVNLLFLVDPVRKPYHAWNSTQTVSGNVKKGVNYYQRYDTTSLLLPGFKLQGYKISPGENVEWKLDDKIQSEMDMKATAHTSIAADKSTTLQTPTRTRIENEVKALTTEGQKSSGRWKK